MFARNLQEKEIEALQREVDKLLASDLEPDKMNLMLDKMEAMLAERYHGLRIES